MVDRKEYFKAYSRRYYYQIRKPKDKQFFEEHGISPSGLARRKLKQEIARLRAEKEQAQ